MGTRQLGDGNQAETYVDQFQGRKVVVKAVPHPDVPVARSLEWWMLEREARALKQLEDVEYVPDFVGYPESHAFAMEFRDGEILRHVSEGDLTADYFEQLEEAVHSIHRRGIVHADLKRRENLMVTPNGEPVILDFGTHLKKKPPYRFIHQFAYRQCHQMDLNAVSKLKQYFCPEAVTPEDEHRLQNPIFFEKLDRFRRNYIWDW